jgi:hypothetical protein
MVVWKAGLLVASRVDWLVEMMVEMMVAGSELKTVDMMVVLKVA